MSKERIAELKRKLAARRGVNGLAENVKALEAEIARLESAAGNDTL